MSYEPDSGEASAVLRRDAEIPGLVRPTTRTRFVAPGSVTGGRYGLFRWEMDPGANGPSPHFHRTFSESFYILEGTVRLYDGREWVAATAGDFLQVPEGGVHAFDNHGSSEPAAMLILFAPAPPREEYFIGLAEIADSGRKLTPEEMTAFLAKHDQYAVPPDEG